MFDNMLSICKKIIYNCYFIFSKSIDLDLSENHLNKVLNWSVDRITNINELIHDNYRFIWVKPSKSALKSMDYNKGNNYIKHNINN